MRSRSARRRRCRRHGTRYLGHRATRGKAFDDHCGREGFEVGRPGQVGVDRSRGVVAAFNSSGGASLLRLVTKASCARTRSARACWKSSAVRLLPSTAGPAPRPTRPACAWPTRLTARERRGGGVQGEHRGAFEEGRRGGQAASGLRPPGRRSSSPATSSSGPDTAWARCQARRSASVSGSMASARAPCASLFAAVYADGRPPSAPGDGETAPGHRTRRGRPRSAGAAASASIPSCAAARQTSAGSPTGRPPPPAAVAASARETLRSACGRSLPCRRVRAPRRAYRTRRPAGPGSGRAELQQRQRIAARLGDDLIAYPVSSGPRRAESSSCAGSATGRPATASSGRPAVSPGGRARENHGDRLRPKRRATNAENLRRGAVDHCSHRPNTAAVAPRRLGQQAQHRETDQEPVGADPTHAECRPQRFTLRHRQIARAEPASARTTDATRRTAAPSPTALRRPARSGTPTPRRPDTPAAPSCPHLPRRAPPEPGSHRAGPPPVTRRALGVPGGAPAGPPPCRRRLVSPEMTVLRTAIDG